MNRFHFPSTSRRGTPSTREARRRINRTNLIFYVSFWNSLPSGHLLQLLPRPKQPLLQDGVLGRTGTTGNHPPTPLLLPPPLPKRRLQQRRQPPRRLRLHPLVQQPQRPIMLQPLLRPPRVLQAPHPRIFVLLPLAQCMKVLNTTVDIQSMVRLPCESSRLLPISNCV